MATGCAIQLLDVTTFPSPDDVQNPGFTDLFNELVGGAGTAADGFDTDLEDANALLDALDNALSELGGADGGTLDDTFEEILQFDPADAGGHVVQASAAIADAHTNVDQLGGRLAAASVPAAPSTTPQCAAVQIPGAVGFGQLVSQQIALQNTAATPLTIRSMTLVPLEPTVWNVTPDVTGLVLQPGQSVTLTISVRAEPGSFSGKLTLNTDRPDPQPCVTWSATFTIPPAETGAAPAPGSGLIVLRSGGVPAGFGPNA